MFFLQPFNIFLLLFLGASLASAAAPDTNSCTVLACGNPGVAGLPGRDGRDGAKGEKGDTGLQVRGQQGFPGKAGPAGPKGNTGAQGEKGQKEKCQPLIQFKGKLLLWKRWSRHYKLKLPKAKKIFSMQGVTTIGGKTFVSTGQSDNFANGKALCSNTGGALAAARNVAENTALAAMAKRNGKHIYLGISDIQTEGKFVYLNGQAVGYTKWKRTEPNNLNEEDCVILLPDTQWNDISCDHQTLIVCEL
ncbi:mannose-binding protein-like [Thamnophis elegans]|uniref:mannose-binding protein-like n=1 Tax=Thamnophis elegans TaxID=35005 RepID=UPI0013775CEE|nr:mannose-binding protein-like [Thamnophis elegans]